MDKKKVLKVFKELEWFTSGDYDEHFEELQNDGYLLELEDNTGGAGDGAEISEIHKITKDGEVMFVKQDGYYSSWDSSSLKGRPYEVESYEKTVKDWRKVK